MFDCIFCVSAEGYRQSGGDKEASDFKKSPKAVLEVQKFERDERAAVGIVV